LCDRARRNCNRRPAEGERSGSPRPPRPGEPIWTIRANHVTWSCEFRFHGESYGWEAQILRDGERVIGHRFILRQLAEAWAEAERQILAKGGP
jgi:hypothetical protein